MLARISAGVSKVNGTEVGRQAISERMKEAIQEGRAELPTYIPTEEQLKERSENSKELWKDPEYRRKQREGFEPIRSDPEWREAMRAKQEETWRDENLIDRHSEIFRKKFEDPEYLAAHQERMRDPEYRERQAMNSEDNWTNPDYREKTIAAMRKNWASEEYRIAVAKGRQKRPKMSRLSLRISEMLTNMGIEHQLEYRVVDYLFDVFIPSHNLLIELNGEFFHRTPVAVARDANKAAFLKSRFPDMRLEVIWELDFAKVGKLDYLIRKILRLEKATPTIPVELTGLIMRRVEDRKLVKLFYADHHYIDSMRAGTHIGLYHGEVLIGCSTFSRFQREQQQQKYPGAVELSRFCLHPLYQAPNMGSWFLSRCLKVIKSPVVTYADTTHGHDGALYKACNFTFSHEVNPDYWWVDQDGHLLHKKTVWDRARKMLHREKNYAELHLLTQQWGGKKLCFRYGF